MLQIQTLGEKVSLAVCEKVLPGAEGCVQSSFLSVALVLGLQTVRWKQHQQQVWRLATVTALFKHLQIPSVHKAVIYTCETDRNQTIIQGIPAAHSVEYGAGKVKGSIPRECHDLVIESFI